MNKKLLFLSIHSVLIAACGGGGSSPAPTPSLTPPASTPVTPDLGIPVSVDSRDASQNPLATCSNPEAATQFVDVTIDAGITYVHANPQGDGFQEMSGGIAAGDIDGDGWVDLYAVAGSASANVLLRNRGDGTFENISELAGVNIQDITSGPSMADINGDGLMDLFVGGIAGVKPALFINQGNGNFADMFEQSGLSFTDNVVTATWADIDKDGDLDLMVGNWTDTFHEYYPYLWRNNGDLTFTDISVEAGITAPQGTFPASRNRTFSATFADINNDSWLDLLWVIDNGFSKVFANDGDGTFTETTDKSVITDRAGMGSAVGDYDNDGDLDWFVSSISYKDGVTDFGSLTPGNRFYQNQGDGTFVDVTDETGTRHGYWGWGSCFADINNDTHLDIFHVNGMYQDTDKGVEEQFESDPSRLFVANGDGSFTESAVALGIDDRAMGRGVVCFDYDRDGDQDLYVANYNGAPKLFCNTGSGNHFLNIRLKQSGSNSQALGAKVYVKTGDLTQMRELSNGNNYVSQNPAEAHIGLGQADNIDEVRIVWPDGEESRLLDVEINQFLRVERTD